MVKSFTRKAAEIAMRHYRRTEGRRKGNQGIVTDADREIEEFIKLRIRDVYPSERILGEESGFSDGSSGPANSEPGKAQPAPSATPKDATDDLIAKLGGLPKKQSVKELFKDLDAVAASSKPASAVSDDVLWAIDPIDGTSAFAAGLPIWAISVGIMIRNVPDIGVVCLPSVDELYWADESGMFMNNRPVKMRVGTDQFDSESAILVPSNSHRKYAITMPGKTRSMGSLTAHMVYVAAGSADAALLGRPNLWDIAAGAAMILHQGGVVLTLSGKPCDWTHLMTGKRPPEPIICGPEKTVRAMIPHIAVKEEVDY